MPKRMNVSPEEARALRRLITGKPFVYQKEITSIKVQTIMPSEDGKGRTLFDILTGRNQRDMTPLELQYHNPLEAKVGCTVSFDEEESLKGINFVIEKISVYETKIGRDKFHHTDYHLKGISLDHDNYIRLRLRVTPDENVTNKLGCTVQLLHLYDEMGWDEGFWNCVNDPSGEFQVNYDDAGQELPEPTCYFRPEISGRRLTEAYSARLTLLQDKDGNATIEENELEHYNVTYWDFGREAQDENEQPFIEYLYIEMDDESRYFTFLRGRDILPADILVF